MVEMVLAVVHACKVRVSLLSKVLVKHNNEFQKNSSVFVSQYLEIQTILQSSSDLTLRLLRTAE